MDTQIQVDPQRHHSVHVMNQNAGLHVAAPTLTQHASQNFSYKVGPAIEEDDPKFKSDIEKANIFSQLNFLYVYKVLWKAFKNRKNEQGLRDPDLTTFPYRRRADTLSEKFREDYEGQRRKNPNKKPNLTLAIIRSTKWTFLTS